MKKRKKTLKKSIYIFIFIIIFGGITIWYFNINDKQTYSEEVTLKAAEFGVEDVINDYMYSKTLEEAILNNWFKPDYLEAYLAIDYIENEDFLQNVDNFLSKGYNPGEINDIFTLSENNISKLLNNNYYDFSKYKDVVNFNVDNFERYELYGTDNDYEINNIVTYVNIGLDKNQYESPTAVENPSSLNVLVNKYNVLSSDYAPEGLRSISGTSYQLTNDAATGAENLLAAATDAGYNFLVFSAYRSYSRQTTLYNDYSITYGADAADTFSARAGHSEHQTGLAVDIYNPTHYAATGVRLNDDDYAWVLENAHKYGYIVRYPKDKTHITGYIEEPWHLRYLGVELATKVVESGLTYDEYYDIHILKY